jgi:hypothetical protein
MSTDEQRETAREACDKLQSLHLAYQDLSAALRRWRSTEDLNQDDLAGYELVDARNAARDLKRRLDAIMDKLGGW